MNISFSSLGQYNVIDADVEVNEINGVGGAAAPQVWLPLRLNVSHGVLGAHDGYEFIQLVGRLFLDGIHFARALPVPISFLIQPGFATLKNQLLYLEFVFDAVQIEALERSRKGGDLKLRLEATLEVMQLRLLNPSSGDARPFNPVWAQVQRHRPGMSTEIVVPRTTWIERVLSRVGYGQVHLIELPAITVEKNEQYAHAFEALRQAQSFHHTGHYAQAVGMCRVALEEFFELKSVTDKGVSRSIPVLKASWETKLGKATYEWLNASLAALKAGSNKPHHLASATYSQFDSQMLQMVTIAVVSYAAKNADSQP
jgi:hypothetical protein